MKYFTSDWHLQETRIGVDGKPNLFYRPFSSYDEQHNALWKGFINSPFKDGDELYHLGDVTVDPNERSEMFLMSLRRKYPNSKFHLIVGNYDDDKFYFLKPYFDTINYEDTIEIQYREFYLNHYPESCIDKEFSITGHIHGLWKVQKNMINVGVDAWHFQPVSENTIMFCRNAIENYYDKNVFPY